ncbi:MAG: HIT family protein [Nitrososphaerales archaeon]
MECIFCRIVKKEIPCHRVYEDDKVLAFLDINPLAKGHTLVIPKKHTYKLEDLEEEDAKALLMATYKLAPKVCSAMKSPASTIAINNGRESGQEIEHLHIHIIPRFRNDGGGPIHAIMRYRPNISREEMNRIVKQIREA